jgi:NADH-quinone oxidoreductase subunit J
MLNLGERAAAMERSWLTPGIWVGPAILAGILMLEVVLLLWGGAAPPVAGVVVEPKAVGIALYGPYLIAVELASMLLLAGLVGAYHLGRQSPEEQGGTDGLDTRSRRAAAGGDPVRAGTDRTPGAP